MQSVVNTRQVMHQTARFAFLKSRAVLWGMVIVLLLIGAAALFAYSRSGTQQTPEIAPQAVVQTKLLVPKINPEADAPAVSAESNAPSGEASDAGPDIAALKAAVEEAVESVPPSAAVTRKPVPFTNRSSVETRPSQSDAFTSSNANARRPVGISSRAPFGHPADRNKSLSATRGPGPSAAPEPDVVRNPALSQNTRTSVPTPRPSISATGTPYPNAERMTDGRLKVQAIVWAQVAEDRMAVVNNHIVREGAAVEGFSLVAIGEDAVYVKEGGRILKVPFGKN
jgi:hypothetical protein